MASYGENMDRLDPDQRKAAIIGQNAVVAAGAGSGKTGVLAARYLHLVVECGIPPDRILALTFTKKAASEMYQRIYGLLRSTDHERAREAAAQFHRARIETIDAFCNSVARSACRRYGISPDFTIDAESARELAQDLALGFFLERRSTQALKHLLRRYALSELPARLFADTMIRYAPLSSPPDFTSFFDSQKREASRFFDSKSDAFYSLVASLTSLSGGSGAIWDSVKKAIAVIPERAEPADRPSMLSFLTFVESIFRLKLPGNVKQQALIEMKSLLNESRTVAADIRYAANFLLNEDIVRETFSLLGEFCELYNGAKRERGVLTFTDVSALAVDALRDDIELRDAWKNSLDAVMIDEFQDDNSLQKDLLYLLAEKPERKELSVPDPRDLRPDALFFVGDEKQSIYRFRGADVSVFRSLSSELGSAEMPTLETNYRTEKALIEAFNAIFPSVFLSGDLPAYEARFSPIRPSRNTAGDHAGLEVLVVPAHLYAGDDEVSDQRDEAEIRAVADEIARLVSEKVPIRGKDGLRPCESRDIAVLFRAGKTQRLYESALRERGIPCQTESLLGLFDDAPVNDMYALLRLAVYPEDTHAYAVVLRSPLCGANDETLARAILSGDEPFGEKTADLLEGRERERFAKASELYGTIRASADRMSLPELVSLIWYDYGYRYTVLEKPEYQRFGELYDYFFELARRSEERGETLSLFLDRIDAMRLGEEKPEGLDIPVERSAGVHLMTVHKSKGLEFPVVFIVNASYGGNRSTNSDPVYFSPVTGLSVNTGRPEDCPTAGENWFFKRDDEEEKKKALAELRRLLYVAMTRAETRLYISGQVRVAKSESPCGNEEELREFLVEADKGALSSFFDLLVPVLAKGPIPGVRLRAILPRKGEEVIRETVSVSGEEQPPLPVETEALYAGLPVVSHAVPPKRRVAVTALFAEPGGQGLAALTPAPEKSVPRDSLDILLESTGVTPADFGTLVHRCIESRFSGTGFPAEEALYAEAMALAERFFTSELGKRALASPERECEMGFLTRWQVDDDEILVTGQIDLAFLAGEKILVVDYKTDKVIDPALHEGQLSVYRKAASEIWGKPCETWLYYLRTATPVKV